MNTVHFCGYDCDVRKIQYPNQQLALELVASDTKNNSQQGIIPGEPVCVATVCLPDFKFKPHQSAISEITLSWLVFWMYLKKQKLLNAQVSNYQRGMYLFLL